MWRTTTSHYWWPHADLSDRAGRAIPAQRATGPTIVDGEAPGATGQELAAQRSKALTSTKGRSPDR